MNSGSYYIRYRVCVYLPVYSITNTNTKADCEMVYGVRDTVIAYVFI